jgi:hypothetical protein
MLKITIHNVETGEVVERELTAAELADMAKREAADVVKMQERNEHLNAKRAVIDKLGLTPDEVASLLA